MPSYLVETFLARGAAGEREARERRARSAAEAMTREGTRVGFEGSIHVPEDEICFFTFAAPSGREAALVAQRAGLEPLRVVEAIPSARGGTVKSRLALLVVLLGAVAFVGAGPGVGAPPPTQCAPAAEYPAATTPVAFWSTEARCAIVPAGPGGIFGSENFGNKFPGEAAVYMGIVHVAIYDAAVAIEGGYRPYATTPAAPANTSFRATSARPRSRPRRTTRSSACSRSLA